jgi:hypothetical protein
MPTRDAVGRTRIPFYGPESFTYLPESNSYICPAGQQLNYGGRMAATAQNIKRLVRFLSGPTTPPILASA